MNSEQQQLNNLLQNRNSSIAALNDSLPFSTALENNSAANASVLLSNRPKSSVLPESSTEIISGTNMATTAATGPLFAATVDSLGGVSSPILQSLFARIEAEFQNLAQENSRLQLENARLMLKIEELQQQQQQQQPLSSPTSSSSPTAVAVSNNVNCCQSTTEHSSSIGNNNAVNNYSSSSTMLSSKNSTCNANAINATNSQSCAQCSTVCTARVSSNGGCNCGGGNITASAANVNSNEIGGSHQLNHGCYAGAMLPLLSSNNHDECLSSSLSCSNHLNNVFQEPPPPNSPEINNNVNSNNNNNFILQQQHNLSNQLLNHNCTHNDNFSNSNIIANQILHPDSANIPSSTTTAVPASNVAALVLQPSSHPGAPPMTMPMYAPSSADHKTKSKVAQRTKTGINKIVSTFKAGTLEAVNSGSISNRSRNSNSNLVVATCSAFYRGHTDSVWDIDAHPEFDVIASASSDRTVKLWAPGVNLQPVFSYAGHQGCVNSARLHPKEPLVLSASGDGSVHIWRYSKERMLQRKNAYCNAAAAAKQNVYSSGDDDLGNDEATLSIEAAQSSSLNSSSNNNNFNTNDSIFNDEFANAADYFTLQPPIVIKQPEVRICPSPGTVISPGPVVAAEFLRGSAYGLVVSGGWDHYLLVSDALNGRLVRINEGHEGKITNVNCARNSALYASSSEDRTFRVWDINNHQVVFVCEGHSRKVRSAVFCGNSENDNANTTGSPFPHILSSSDDSTLKLWDLRNMSSPLISIRMNSEINRFSVLSSGLGIGRGSKNPFTKAPNILSPLDTEIVACPLDNRSIRIYSLSVSSARARRLSSIPSHSSSNGGNMGGVISSRSNRSFNASSSVGSAAAASSSSKSINHSSSHDRMVTSVAWANSGNSLISGSIDGSVLEWKLDFTPKQNSKNVIQSDTNQITNTLGSSNTNHTGPGQITAQCGGGSHKKNLSTS